MKFVGWEVRAAIIAAVLGVALGAVTLASAGTCKGTWSSVPSSAIATGLWGVEALSPTDAWAISSAFNGAGPSVAHWDGTSWSPVASPVGGLGGNRSDLNGMIAFSPTDVWAAGFAMTQHWDGTSWRAVAADVAALYPEDVGGTSGGDLWAVGNPYGGPFSGQAAIAHWDGTSWSVVPSVTNAGLGAMWSRFYGVASLSRTNAWAVGTANTAIGTYRSLIVHWDGTAWQIVPSPNLAFPFLNILLAVSAVSADDVWAVGGGGLSFAEGQAFIEHWDGTSWSVVSSPPLDSARSQLTGIAAISANDVWAVGSSTTADGSTSMLIEHWDGTSWSIVSAPSAGRKVLHDVSALRDGTVFAVGSAGWKRSVIGQLCEIRVFDAEISPPISRGIGFRNTVAWGMDAANSSAHSVTDASGMGLFDSGLRPPGGSFTYDFPAAGSYKLIDSATGHTSTISVGMTAMPTGGTAVTPFSLRWAAASPPSGYAFDVKVLRPGATAYADFLTGTGDPSATFTPDSGVGIYSFRARIRNTSNGASSGWSSAKTITIG
jgi:hypothetical protein